MATPSEMARRALEHSEALETEFKLLKLLVETHDLPAIRDLLVRIETRLTAFEKFEAEFRRISVIDDRVNKLEKRAEATEKQQERLAVVESQQADMKKAKDESDKRGWQLLYIVVGAGFAFVSSVVV